jgi:hypothetical protein
MRNVFGPECTEDWVYAVGIMYESYLTATTLEPTPRLINTLINSAGVLWLQWKNQIPFETLVYYLINKSAIEENLGVFIQNGRAEISQFDPDWVTSLAAVHYGVPPENALQVHLAGSLTDAIRGAKVEEFARYGRIAGFERVFESVLAAAVKNHEFISSAGYLLGELNPAAASWVTSSWRTLVVDLAIKEPWTALRPENVKGVRHILQKAPIAHLRQQLPALSQSLLMIAPAAWEVSNRAVQITNRAQQLLVGYCRKLPT